MLQVMKLWHWKSPKHPFGGSLLNVTETFKLFHLLFIIFNHKQIIWTQKDASQSFDCFFVMFKATNKYNHCSIGWSIDEIYAFKMKVSSHFLTIWDKGFPVWSQTLLHFWFMFWARDWLSHNIVRFAFAALIKTKNDCVLLC